MNLNIYVFYNFIRYMRKNKANEVLSFLSENASESFSAKELSEKLNISERMIRNYFRQLNESSKKAMILSDGGKYRIDPSFDHNNYETEHPDLSNQERVMVILSRLLTAEEAIDLFDLADELYVSESTIEADLKKVRRRLEPFHLSLSYDHGKLMIQGSEKDRRSFTSYMITNTRYKGFMFNDTKHFLNDEYQISFIKENLVRIFNECYFFFNDYSLNNIILHIIITIDRLKNNCYLEETPFNLNISEIENKAAAMIVGFLEENYDVKVSKAEANNIASFLSCNLATLDYRMIHPDNIETYISHETVELVRYILNKITDFYQIDSFDDVFFARFSLHVDNLLKRQSAHFSVHNPMQMDIKYSYPLIFDIAVYAASLIKEKTSYEINQDEISLIALHIGSFIESNDSNKSKISAVYVYADYHQFYQQNITKIQHRFENDLNLMYTISIIDLKSLQQKPDLLISEVSIEDAIQVSPFITAKQLDTIQEAIEQLSKKKENARYNEAVRELFKEELFFTDLYGEDEFDILHKLCAKLKDKGYIDDAFAQSVETRERLSSTCFIKRVAIPHAIGETVSKSFISMITYQRPQKWGNEEVDLVILFGISYAERKNFRLIFNQIVAFFNDQANITRLSKCRSYKEVIELTQSII